MSCRWRVDQLSWLGRVSAMVVFAQDSVSCGGLDLQMFAAAKEFHAPFRWRARPYRPA